MIVTAELTLRGSMIKKLIERELRDFRESYGLKRIEIEVLYLLANSSKDTVAEIAAFLDANRGHISQTVESLCQKGYITPVPDQKDRRYIHFELTERGRDLSVPIRERWNALTEDVFRGISPEELEQYKSTSMKIRHNIERLL